MDELLGALFGLVVDFFKKRGARAAFAPVSGRLQAALRDPSAPVAAPPDPPVEIRRPAPPPRAPAPPEPEASPDLAPWAAQFRTPQGLLGAIVASEVLGPPKAMR